MKLTPDSLPGHLARELSPVYLVSGDEPLLVAEAADAIRARARAAGFDERIVHFIERGTRWEDIRAESQSLSLFAQRRIIELRMPGGKPGTAGGATIAELAGRADRDTLLIILTGRLDRDAQGASWVRAVEAGGAWLQIWPLDRARLPAWIDARAKRAGLSLDRDAAALLADRTEGNLLAAQQEIDKLALSLQTPASVGVAEIEHAVADSARYDVFALGAAALEGDAVRALRIIEGLQAEGVEATLVLWALLREVRSIEARVMGGTAPYGTRPSPALDRAARRIGSRELASLVARAARADRAIKGQLRVNAWDELAQLAAALCGARPLDGKEAA